MFESIGINRVIVSEVHNVAAFENAFRRPTWHIESAPLFAAHFAPLLRNDNVVAVTHGLSIDGAPELFATEALDGIVIANTVPSFHVPTDLAAKHLAVPDASESIARVIAMCHDGI